MSSSVEGSSTTLRPDGRSFKNAEALRQNGRMVDDSRQVYPYQVDRRYLPVLLVFGFRPGHDSVRLEGDTFIATFGFVKVRTHRGNISGAHITRNYRWWTAVGARMSFVDDGLTLGTNHDAGVCIHFIRPVPSALRRSGHSALTATVADLDGLVQELGLDPPAT